MGKNFTRFMAAAAILSSAMAINAAEQPVDLTNLIKNPDMHTWESNNIAGYVETNFFERFNWGFGDFYQTLHKMPAGIYTLKCQGFSRNGNIATALENGNPAFVYLYINDAEAPFPSLYSDDSYTVDPYTYPDNVQTAKEALEAGKYQVSVTVTTTETQDLKIGQIRKCNDGNEDHNYRAQCWYVSSGFKLYYKASEDAPEEDVTYKISNPDFELRNGNNFGVSVWNYDSNRGPGFDHEHVAKEYYQGTFKATQNISGLQAGKYKVTVQGFLRGNQTPWIDENTQEEMDPAAYLIANSEKSALQSFTDFTDNVYQITTREGDDGSIIEERTRIPGIGDLAAAGISFDEGMYNDNAVFVTINEGEDLTIGLEKAVHENRSWVAFRHFGLFYLPPIAAPTSKDITGDEMAFDFATDGAKHITLAHEDADVTIYHKWEDASTAVTFRSAAPVKEGFVEHTADGLDITGPGTLSYYAMNEEGQESPLQTVVFTQGTPTGSAVISAYDNDENAPVQYFNLLGVPVSNPAQGDIIIEKKGTQVRKIVVK